MEDEFQKLPPKEQVVAVTKALAEGDYGLLELFTLQHNPQTQTDTSIELKSALSSKEFFLDILGEAENRPDCFMVLVRLWSRIDGFEKHLPLYGGLHSIAKAMKAQRTNLDLIENACVALGSFATDESVRSGASGTDVIPCLIRVLQDFPSNSLLLSRACKALNNFCYHEDNNKAQFLDCGGYSPLKDIFTSASCDDTAKQYAALLLRTVAKSDFSSHAPTIVEEIIDIMELTESESEVQWHLLWATTNLTLNKIKLKREFGKKSGIERILQAMRTHPQNCLIQKAACICIFQLSVATINRMAVGKANGVADVVAVVLSFKQIEVLEMALECLNRLCIQSINRKKLIASQKIDALIDLLSENREDRDIVLITLGIFYKLANGADESKSCLKKTKILSFLPTIRALYSKDEAVHEVINAILVDTHKPGHNSHENSDQSDDSESSDDLDLRNLQFSLQSNSIGPDDEDDDERDESRTLLVRQQQLKKQLQQHEKELQQQALETSSLERQLKALEDRGKNRENGNVIELLELTSQNKSLLQDKDELSRTIAGLCMKATTQKDKMNLATQQKNLCAEETKQQNESQAESIRAKTQILAQQEATLAIQREKLKELEETESQLETAKEILKEAQRMTFHWMALALKLDHLCKSKKSNINFDKQSLFDRIVDNKIPHREWSTEILKELENSS